MIPDLLVDVVSTVRDRPEHRTRFEQASVVLGVMSVLAGIVVLTLNQEWYGALLTIVGAFLVLYGR